MWGMSGTTEEDKLDRDGVQRVLRRTAGYAKPIAANRSSPSRSSRSGR